MLSNWLCFPFESRLFHDVKRKGQIPTSVRKPYLFLFLGYIVMSMLACHGFRTQGMVSIFPRVLPVQTNCMKHAFADIPVWRRRDNAKTSGFAAHLLFDAYVLWFLNSFHVLRQWPGPSVSKTCIIQRFYSSVLTIWVWMGIFCAALKGYSSWQAFFSAPKFRETWTLDRGGEIYPSTCSSVTNSAFHPPIAVSWMTFSEIQTLWVTWLLIVQDDVFSVFLYELGVWRK